MLLGNWLQTAGEISMALFWQLFAGPFEDSFFVKYANLPKKK